MPKSDIKAVIYRNFTLDELVDAMCDADVRMEIDPTYMPDRELISECWKRMNRIIGAVDVLKEQTEEIVK